LCSHRFGRALDQRLPGGDVIHQKEQVANLFRLEQRSLDARLIGKPGGIEQSAQRGRNPLRQQQPHLARKTMLLVDPGSIPRWLHRQHPLAGYSGMDEGRHQLQQAAPFERLTAAFIHHRRYWL
jgi:hypothetical protein